MHFKSYIIPLAVVGVGIAWFGVPRIKERIVRPAEVAEVRVNVPSRVVRVSSQNNWCRESRRNRSRGWYCEVREFTVPARGDVLAVDAGANGGIEVEGWSRNEIHVTARVAGQARTDEVAEDLVSEVTIQASGSRLDADGPRTSGRESWSVSYRISVPHQSDLTLETTNGGISVEEVTGAIDFRATNGGVSLAGVGGDVRGRTTNGGLDIRLSGGEWVGRGLDVRTTNGGVKLSIPDGYSAQLETGTVNGGLTLDFPITVTGRIDRKLSTTLGDGGALIKATTTNGGVAIRRW